MPTRKKTKIVATIGPASSTREVLKGMLDEGVDLLPVSVQEGSTFYPVYEPGQLADLEDPSLPEGWTNYYRSDDVSSVAYFYLDRPESNLPPLAPVNVRVASMH